MAEAPGRRPGALARRGRAVSRQGWGKQAHRSDPSADPGQPRGKPAAGFRKLAWLRRRAQVRGQSLCACRLRGLLSFVFSQSHGLPDPSAFMTDTDEGHEIFGRKMQVEKNERTECF